MPRLPILSALVAAAALSACSPLQQCLNAADRDLREVRRELDERRANLSRGYAIDYVPSEEMVPGFCPNGTASPQPCFRWVSTTEEVRRPINAEFEAERVRLLESQLARAETLAATSRAQCAATYPE